MSAGDASAINIDSASDGENTAAA